MLPQRPRTFHRRITSLSPLRVTACGARRLGPLRHTHFLRRPNRISKTFDKDPPNGWRSPCPIPIRCVLLRLVQSRPRVLLSFPLSCVVPRSDAPTGPMRLSRTWCSVKHTFVLLCNRSLSFSPIHCMPPRTAPSCPLFCMFSCWCWSFFHDASGNIVFRNFSRLMAQS